MDDTYKRAVECHPDVILYLTMKAFLQLMLGYKLEAREEFECIAKNDSPPCHGILG